MQPVLLLAVQTLLMFSCFIENYNDFETEGEDNQTVISHPTYGNITADIVHLNNTIFAYSVAVVFSDDSLSDSCAVLFINSLGCLIATTKFTDRYA